MSNSTKSILENEVIFDNPKCLGFTTGSLVVKLPKDSILDSVNTGFGGENTLIKDCPKPRYVTHLIKENYLSEFSEPDVSKGVDITFVIPVDYYGTITHEDSNTGQINIEGDWYVLKEDSGMVSETADELIYPISTYAVWETAWNTYSLKNSLDSMYNYMY